MHSWDPHQVVRYRARRAERMGDLVVARPRGTIGFGFDTGIDATGPLVVGRAARAILG